MKIGIFDKIKKVNLSLYGSFFQFFLILVLVFSFAGCKKKETVLPIQPQQPSIAKPEIKKTVIKFSSWGSESEVKVLKKAISEFEKQNPDIHVEFVHIPENYFQKIHLLIVANAAPDVMFVNNINGLKYYRAGSFENLNPYFLHKHDFYPNSVKAFTYNGNVWAVPRDLSNLVIYYNKDLFDKYHVPYPSTGWTMEDFQSKAQALTTQNTWGFGFEKDSLFWLPFLWSNNGGILGEDDCIMFDSVQSRKSLQYYADLKNVSHVTPSDAQKGSYTNAQLFMQGKLGMMISGRWVVPRFRQDIKFNWDIAQFPQGTGGSVVDADASGWAMSKKSKNKRAAWRLILFLSSERMSKEFTRDGLIIPARKSVATSNLFLQKGQKPQNSQVFLKAIEHGKPTPVTRNYQELLDKIYNRIDPVFAGIKQIDDVVNENLIISLQKEI
jgi:multiple sugar transport system substrate-binding protein